MSEDLKVIVPSCSATAEELAAQRERQAKLAPSIRRAERREDAFVVEFAPGFPRATLDDLIAVEQRCCPFFVFEFDDAARRLEVSVRDAAHRDALDAIGALLGAPANA